MKMKHNFFFVQLVISVIFFLFPVPWTPQILAKPFPPAEEGNRIIYPHKSDVKPVIDGILADKTWQTPPLKVNFFSYEPTFGEKLSQKTLVWMTYDSKNLYFAFQCFDPEPLTI